jgi:hypothetical protein
VNDHQSAWLEWVKGLPPTQGAAAEWLRVQFGVLGVADPVDLIKSEVLEDLPQLARFVLLRGLWRGAIDAWSEPGSLDQLPAAQRLLAAGADEEDLVRLVRAVAYEAVFVTLDELDAGREVNTTGVDAGWVVMESGADGSPTGRTLAGLHEDLLTMDPSGCEGADLWE